MEGGALAGLAEDVAVEEEVDGGDGAAAEGGRGAHGVQVGLRCQEEVEVDAEDLGGVSCLEDGWPGDVWGKGRCWKCGE